MSTLTIDELRTTLCKALGEDTSTMPDDFAGALLEQLGVDSLALIETVGEVGRSRGIRLSDTQIDAVKTPGELLVALNKTLEATEPPAAQ